MRPPLEVINLRTRYHGFAGNFRWCISVKRSVNTFLIVIILELTELSLEINRIPEKNMIEKFSTNRSY